MPKCKKIQIFAVFFFLFVSLQCWLPAFGISDQRHQTHALVIHFCQDLTSQSDSEQLEKFSLVSSSVQCKQYWCFKSAYDKQENLFLLLNFGWMLSL